MNSSRAVLTATVVVRTCRHDRLDSSRSSFAHSFNGLCGIVLAEFARDIRDGDLFLFLNRRGDRIKAMYWDRDGIAIWMKRLEQGTFQRPLANAANGGTSQVEMDATDLSLLLSGIDLNSAKRRQRYVVSAQ